MARSTLSGWYVVTNLMPDDPEKVDFLAPEVRFVKLAGKCPTRGNLMCGWITELRENSVTTLSGSVYTLGEPGSDRERAILTKAFSKLSADHTGYHPGVLDFLKKRSSSVQ